MGAASSLGRSQTSFPRKPWADYNPTFRHRRSGDAGLRIIHYPHPTLRQRAEPVRRVDAELRKIVAEMFELMYAQNGVGLAANQVDLPIRMFVVNTAGNPDEGEELVFINPVISRPKGTCEHQEGCLSLPGLYADVTRPEVVHVQAYTPSGNEIDTDLDGFLSRVVQHELDHLDGILFFDRLSEPARLGLEPTLEEFQLVYQQKRNSLEIPDDATIEKQWSEWKDRYCR